MSEGVEWALHVCLDLAWLAEQGSTPVPTARLAAAHELPPAYLGKHLQALVAAGILGSTPGPRGGFRLARALADISLLDVVTAIEGPDEAFRCREIRRRGAGAGGPPPCGPCAIAAAMHAAEAGWRRELATRSLDGIRAAVDRDAPHAAPGLRRWFDDTRARPAT